MLFTTQNISNEEMNAIHNFFNEFDSNVVNTVDAEEIIETPVAKYITSLASNCYSKAVQDIANTKIGNKIVRKRNLQQVMRESFFYGSNRFGNNFIA